MSQLQRSAACLVAFAVAVACTFGVATLDIPNEALVQVVVFEGAAVLTSWWLAGRRTGLVALVLAIGGCLMAVGISQLLLDDGEPLGAVESMAGLVAVMLVLAPWMVAFLATPLPRDRA